MLDNYDSFTYTLVQYFKALEQEVVVIRNDQTSLSEIKRLNPDHIVISPGPCTPNEAGLSIDLILEFYRTKPILGVCLGHQAIAQAFGGKVVRAKEVMHGKTSMVKHDNSPLFHHISNPFRVTRYHSLTVDPNSLPSHVNATAWIENDDEQIMALSLADYPVMGVQFHPESVLTEFGHQLLSNFLTI